MSACIVVGLLSLILLYVGSFADQWQDIHYGNGGRSSVVRASEFKSEDPGFDPLAGQGRAQFFYPSESTFVQTSLCLS